MISSLSVSLWYVSPFLLGRTLLFVLSNPLSFHRYSFILFHQADLGQLTHVTECKQGLFLSSQLLRFFTRSESNLVGSIHSPAFRENASCKAHSFFHSGSVCVCLL